MFPLIIMLGSIVGAVVGSYQGTDVLLSVVNFSPFETVVNFQGPESCMKHDGPGVLEYVEHYFQSFRSHNLSLEYGQKFAQLDPYLKGYKYLLNISDLGTLTAKKGDRITLPAYRNDSNPAFVTYKAATDADSDGYPDVCGARDSWMEFGIRVNDKESIYRLSDFGQNDDFILQLLGAPDSFGNREVRDSVRLGQTFEVSWKIIVSEAVVAVVAAVIIAATAGAGVAIATAPFGLSTEMWELSAATEAALTAWPDVKIAGGIIGLITAAGLAIEGITWGVKWPHYMNLTAAGNATEHRRYFGIGEAYANMTEENRSACILTHMVLWQPYCGVAGTSIVIQPNGNALALPLPSVSTAWK